MAGRKNKPPELKIVQGTFRKDRDGKKPTKRKKLTKMTPPYFLDEEAKKEWKRIAQPLVDMGLLDEFGLMGLAAYCTNFSRWIAAEKDIDEHGRSYTTVGRNGEKMRRQNPDVAIANEAMKLMKGFLSEFGMTPATRSKVIIKEQEEEDPMEKFLNRRDKKKPKK